MNKLTVDACLLQQNNYKKALGPNKPRAYIILQRKPPDLPVVFFAEQFAIRIGSFIAYQSAT